MPTSNRNKQVSASCKGVSMSTISSRRWSSVGAAVFGILLLSAPVAGASCGPLGPIEEAIDDAPVVFVGTVANVEHDGRLASFSVDEVWKGDVKSTVVVSGGPSPSELEGLGFGESVVTSVDRHFEQGVRYLVVPFGVEDGAYMDNACSATDVYGPSVDDLRPATTHPPIDAGTDGELVVARVALGVIALAVATAVAVNTIRQRASSPQEAVSSSGP